LSTHLQRLQKTRDDLRLELGQQRVHFWVRAPNGLLKLNISLELTTKPLLEGITPAVVHGHVGFAGRDVETKHAIWGRLLMKPRHD
jgi:hypothetical protein